MKRMLSMILTLCLLAGAAGFAQAEAAPLRVLDGWWAVEAYRQQYPERAVETLNRFDENGYSREDEIIRSGAWDAMCVDTDSLSLAELYDLGLVLDLGANEACAALASDLYPAIRAGCSAGDTLVALPVGYIGTRSGSYRLLGTDCYGGEDAEALALRDQLGFTASDQPTTFAEVCALGLRYMALSRETRKGTVFLFSDTAAQGFVLLYNIILTYQCEATDAAGRIEFDTPAFRAALAAADPLLAAFAADPKRTYAKDGSLYIVLRDDTGVEQSYGAFPSVTESGAIPAHMTVVLVNPRSERLSEAIDFALVAAGCGESSLPLLLYQHADYDALLIASYDSAIAAQKEEGEAQSVIDDLEARKAAGDDTYFVPRRVIERYAAEIAPRLVFPRWHSFAMDSLIQGYLSGKLDADGFIAALNEAAQSSVR